MRILDLDLDFFLNDVAYFCSSSGERLTDEYVPWGEVAVREFLEQRCSLKRTAPVPGRLVTHHHEAFLFWKELVQSGVLAVPFDVVHVDAHADLGSGDAGYVYLMTDVLLRPVEDRLNAEIGSSKLNAGNYLAFASGCRWIRRLVYVANPAASDDLMYLHFKNFDPRSGFLQLKGCDQKGLDGIFHQQFSYPFALEPEIPFHKTDPDNYCDREGFNFAVLCRSPGFTPKASDDLIPIIMEYLRPM